jgi:protein O-GlcNAc transferase
VKERYLAIFAHFGIASERIRMEGEFLEENAHLQRYGKMDIVLDTFPYNGTTSTCEALWMGVPVVTWSGEGHLARVGYSLLSQVGLSRMVASTKQGYIDSAIALGKDMRYQEELRGQ